MVVESKENLAARKSILKNCHMDRTPLVIGKPSLLCKQPRRYHSSSLAILLLYSMGNVIERITGEFLSQHCEAEGTLREEQQSTRWPRWSAWLSQPGAKR